MSEEAQVQVTPELEAQENASNQFIDAIQQQNFNKAKEHFDELIGDKLQSRLDAEKVAVADSIFNGADDDLADHDPEDVEEIVDEVTEDDEEIEADDAEEQQEVDEEEVEEDVEEVPQDDEVEQTD